MAEYYTVLECSQFVGFPEQIQEGSKQLCLNESDDSVTIGDWDLDNYPFCGLVGLRK